VPDEGAIPVPVADDETAALSEGAASARLREVAQGLRPTLRILTGVETGRTQVIVDQETVIGRGSQCQLHIDDVSLSRRHCRILRSGDSFVIEDLASRNGTRVNGTRIAMTQTLLDGALIQLAAGVTVKFSVKDDLEVQAEKRLYESAVLDPLTGMHNRRHLDDRLRAELAFALRHLTPLSLLILDVDHFKRINDSLGHAAGDLALRMLAERLHRSVRAEDVVARFGGEEFAVIARGIKAVGALMLAERIRETVARMRTPYDQTVITFTISVGVVTMDADRPFDTAEAMLKTADDALYKAKGSGRNRCVQG
jgi:diguanylate cyclase (GGDEF)-like protein